MTPLLRVLCSFAAQNGGEWVANTEDGGLYVVTASALPGWTRYGIRYWTSWMLVTDEAEVARYRELFKSRGARSM